MQVKKLQVNDWKKLREIRLTALQDSVSSFMSNYECESEYGDDAWIAEFERGHWWVLQDQGESAAGLIGATAHEGRWYLEYLWVTPDLRRRGLAGDLTQHAISHLTTQEGAPGVSLWVLEGNHAAYSLYRQMGFGEDGKVQPLLDGTGRKEIRMDLAVQRAGRLLS